MAFINGIFDWCLNYFECEISYQDVQFIPTYKDWKNTKHRCVKHQLLKPKRLKYFLEQLAILIG